jgi:hypothetical protein
LRKELIVRKAFPVLLVACAILGASMVFADVPATQSGALRQQRQGRKVKHSNGAGAESVAAPNAHGSIHLTDSSGLLWKFNDNIILATSSSASGAASEASYTGPVPATTIGGGVMAATLSDAYDGYQAICISLTGATGPCLKNNASYVIYQNNGSATPDATCGGRQYIFNPQTAGGIQMQRKIYVPATDSFARWINTFTNTTGAPITFNMITSNNLGSDANTVVVTSSNGTPVVTTNDFWVTTFQNYSGTTSTDPRLGHVLRGPGSPPLTGVSFVNGNDNPFWSYTVTLAPGQTKIIMNFGVAQPSKAAAAAKSAELLQLPSVATACLSATELSQIVNFQAQQVSVPTLHPLALAALAVSLALVGLFVLRRIL